MSPSYSEPSVNSDIQRALDLLCTFLNYDHSTRQYHWDQVKQARNILQAIPIESDDYRR
jgi:hypothetical protein